MENKVQNDTKYDDEIDLRELFSVLWAGSRKIVAITAVFALVSIIYSYSLSNQYKATTLLAAAQSDESGISGALSRVGDLAALGGISFGGGGQGTEAQIAQEIMKSWSFIENFITKNDIAVEVYAADGWNRGSNELQIDTDLYNPETKTWLVENVNTGKLGPPSSWTLFESFSERLSVSEDMELGLVSVSIEHYSPKLAKEWLDKYVAAINKHMQLRQVEKATNNINYLQIQVEKTSIAEMRDIFYSLIEEQVKNKMVAEASPDYALVVVSPSMVPEVKSRPSRVLITIFGTLLGGILSGLLVIVTHYARKSD